jgi:hypothetical protein
MSRRVLGTSAQGAARQDPTNLALHVYQPLFIGLPVAGLGF